MTEMRRLNQCRIFVADTTRRVERVHRGGKRRVSLGCSAERAEGRCESQSGIFSRSEFLIESEVRSAESIEARSTGSLSDVAPKARAGGCESRLVLILAKRVSDRVGGIYIYIYSYWCEHGTGLDYVLKTMARAPRRIFPSFLLLSASMTNSRLQIWNCSRSVNPT